MDHYNFYGALRDQESDDNIIEDWNNQNFPQAFKSPRDEDLDLNEEDKESEDPWDKEVIKKKERMTLKLLEEKHNSWVSSQKTQKQPSYVDPRNEEGYSSIDLSIATSQKKSVKDSRGRSLDRIQKFKMKS